MLFVKPCSAMCCPHFAGMEEFIPHDEQHGGAAVNPNGEEEVLMTSGNKDVANDIKIY